MRRVGARREIDPGKSFCVVRPPRGPASQPRHLPVRGRGPRGLTQATRHAQKAIETPQEAAEKDNGSPPRPCVTLAVGKKCNSRLVQPTLRCPRATSPPDESGGALPAPFGWPDLECSDNGSISVGLRLAIPNGPAAFGLRPAQASYRLPSQVSPVPTDRISR